MSLLGQPTLGFARRFNNTDNQEVVEQEERKKKPEEMDSQTIMEALLDLEKMIEDEKRVKSSADTRNQDDIFSGIRPQDEMTRPGGKKGTSLETMAEDLIQLIHRRNEQNDFENIYTAKSRVQSQAPDIKSQLINQLNKMNKKLGDQKKGGKTEAGGSEVLPRVNSRPSQES